MADIEKISVGGTSYDVRDALAAHALSDIAVAGDNVTFEKGPFTDYTVVGAPTINDEYVVSGFSDSNYLSIQNPLYGSGSRSSYELVIAFMVSSVSPAAGLFDARSADSRLTILESNSNNNAGYIRFRTNDIDIKSANVLQFNQKYWVKITYDRTSGYKMLLSTDGVVWNEEASSTNTTSNITLNTVYIGRNVANGWPLNGSVYLQDTYVNVNNGEFVWRPVYGIGLSKINASVPTVDQTYNASSANAQSGVAINGAGFLRNLSTGTNSVDVNYAGTSNNSVTMGANTTSASSAVTFGSSAKGNPYGVSIGRSAGTAGAAGNNSIAIGNNSSSSQYTGGCTAGANSTALGSMTFARGNNSVAVGGATAMFQAAQAAGEDCVSIGFMALSGADSTTNSVDPTYTPTVGDVAIGGGAIASGGHTIQIGQGTNTTAQTLSVGFGNDTSSNPLNYQLLDSTGTIPSARMPSDVLKNAATGSNSICILGNANGDASGSRSVAIGTDSYASQNNCVAIGNYAAATGYTSVAVGMCQATANYAIQLGTGKNGDANTFSVGLSTSTNYRLLNSNGTIPGERMALQGTEAPTTATAGSVGQFYVDTTNQIGYLCVSAADSTYVWKQITA